MAIRRGQMDKQKNGNFKHAWDSSYDNGDNNLSYPSEEVVRCFHKNIKSRMNHQDGEKLSVLDFGCGAGRNSLIFDSNDYNVIGYDISTSAIKLATKDYPDSFFTADEEEFMSRKYHLAIADSSLDSMPWLDAVTSVTNIYNTLHKNGFFILSLIESDSKQKEYNGMNDILIKDDFEKNTMQIYFDWVRIERLLLPMFEILSAYKVVHKDSNEGLLFSRWYISCRAN